jgi:hypothetical protein
MTPGRRPAIFVLMLAGASTAYGLQEPGGDSRATPIYVDVEPATVPSNGTAAPETMLRTLPDVPLRISGVAAAVLANQPLSIVITPPQDVQGPDPTMAPAEMPKGPDSAIIITGPAERVPPTTLKVVVTRAGTFEAAYTPRTTGEHEVVVTDGAGRYRGETRFEVENPNEIGEHLREELEREAKRLVEHAHAFVKATTTRLNELPPSPARDEARRKAEILVKALADALPRGGAPSWVNGVEHLAALRRVSPQMQTASATLVRALDDWKREASRANEKAPQVLAAITRGNVVCDQLDIVINGLKFCDFYLGLIVTPGQFFIDWAKENVPTKLIGMLPASRRNPAIQQTIESSWKGLLTFAPKSRDMSGALLEGNPGGLSAQIDSGFERASGVQKMAFDLAQYAASRVFERYCSVFQGPIAGTMAAEAFDRGTLWWKYRTEIQGELVLRYPKDAAGDVIALTGEFLGNATSFRSWDQAVLVLFPKLAMGTVFKTIRLEPFALGASKALADGKGGFNPLTSTIEKGGVIVRNYLTPAFFKVPVRGELRGTTLRIELQEANVDFDDARTKVIQIMLPVLSLMPTVQDYALPYKGARFIMFRALNDGPAEFEVQTAGKQMVIQRTFHRERNNNGTTGTYDLSIKACNPGC